MIICSEIVHTATKLNHILSKQKDKCAYVLSSRNCIRETHERTFAGSYFCWVNITISLSEDSTTSFDRVRVAACSSRPRCERRSCSPTEPDGPFGSTARNGSGLVLGSTEADFCNQTLIRKLLPSSTQYTAPTQSAGPSPGRARPRRGRSQRSAAGPTRCAPDAAEKMVDCGGFVVERGGELE